MLGTDQKTAFERFKARRGLTLKEIAEELRWSKPYLSQVFNGHRPAPPTLVDDLDERFQLRPDERRMFRLALRSSISRVDLSRFSPSQRATIGTFIEEIGGLSVSRQEELIKLVKAYLKLPAEDIDNLMAGLPDVDFDEAEWKYFDYSTGHDKRVGLSVRPLTYKEIHAKACTVRESLRVRDGRKLSKISDFDKIVQVIEPSAQVITRQNLGPLGVKGATDTERMRIYLTEDVRNGLINGCSEARWVAFHELGHLVLHTGERTFDFDGKGIEGAEKQADMFGGFFAFNIADYRNASEVSQVAKEYNLPRNRAQSLINWYQSNGIRSMRNH